MFNAVKPLSIVSERTMENKQLKWENDRCGKIYILYYLGRNL
jgi:hypothetical protein